MEKYIINGVNFGDAEAWRPYVLLQDPYPWTIYEQREYGDPPKPEDDQYHYCDLAAKDFRKYIDEGKGVLNLEQRNLTSLPVEIFMCEELTLLSVCGNYLTEIPPEIGLCENLEELWCTGNALVTLLPDLANCTKLKTLVMGGCRLKSLPPELIYLKLEYFSFRENPELPEEFHRLYRMKGCDGTAYSLCGIDEQLGLPFRGDYEERHRRLIAEFPRLMRKHYPRIMIKAAR